jgi:hypothetical protein
MQEVQMITLKLPLNLPNELQSVQFIDISKQLPINKNYTWEQLAGVRKQEDLTVIVAHHDAWPKSVSAKFTGLQLAQKIAQDHIDSKKNHPKGDAGFPYDLWVRNGVLYLCNDILAREYGVASNNAYTLNICVSGDYVNHDALTDRDRNALYLGILMLKAIMPNFKFIKGHKEITATSCPGYLMDPVRNDIAKIELQMKAVDSPDQLKANIFKNVNQHMYLYKQYQADPVGQKWLEPYLLKMHQITADMGMYFGK